MNTVLRIPLTCNDEQHARLQALQHEFAQACNAIYSVCRACRWAYQHPQSRLKAAADAGQPLVPVLAAVVAAPP